VAGIESRLTANAVNDKLVDVSANVAMSLHAGIEARQYGQVVVNMNNTCFGPAVSPIVIVSPSMLVVVKLGTTRPG
jgi:hypothetical protein